MGLDLTVKMSPWNDSDDGAPLLTCSLSFDRDYDLFDLIKDLPSNALPPGGEVRIYEDEGIEKEGTNPYGEAIRYIFAKEFRELAEPADLSEWSQGILSFLRTIPESKRVYLWWH